MIGATKSWSLSGLLVLGIAGCSSMQPQAGFSDVQGLVADRVPGQIYWNQGTPADAEVEQRITVLLKEPLTVDAAVQIALLNNRNLQATYEELGIAQADLVQAGLLKNPVISFERRFSGQALEVDVIQEFIDLIAIPLRKRIAGAAFEAAKLRVGQAVVDLAADVRASYYMLQGSEQMVEMRRSVVEGTEASAALAERLHEAGNITDLDWRMEQRFAQRARLDLALAEEEVAQEHEHLTPLMGVWGAETAWTIKIPLPDLPPTEVTLPGLESHAVAQRLDLAASKQEIVATAEALGLTRALRFTSSVELASHYEREKDGPFSVGPSLHLALPIFDWGQAAVPRDRAILEQKRQRYVALAIEIRSQLRAAYSRMRSARERAEFYREIVIPLQAEILEQAHLQYNAMILGPLQLFQTKQEEIDAGVAYIEALRSYWVARVDLERAAGGSVEGAWNAPAAEGSDTAAHGAELGHHHEEVNP